MPLVCSRTLALSHADILGLHRGSLLDGWGDYLGSHSWDRLDDLAGASVKVMVAVLAW